MSNLLTIYCAFTGKSIAEAEREFEGQGYGTFKEAVAEVCADALGELQGKYNEILKDKDYLNTMLKTNAEKAQYLARKTLSKVYRKIGFYQPK